jgi:hypothetical protein
MSEKGARTFKDFREILAEMSEDCKPTLNAAVRIESRRDPEPNHRVCVFEFSNRASLANQRERYAVDRRTAACMIRATIVRRDLDAAIGQRRPNGTGSARPGHPDAAIMEVHS